METVKNEEKEKNGGSKRSRIFNFTQQMVHPKTGESLLNEEQIKKIFENEKGFVKWAYILHDKDVDDKGKLKAKHWHIVIQCKNQKSISQISKIFGVPNNQIKTPNGKGAFMDCVAYLTHETEKAIIDCKYEYPRNEVRSNFDYIVEIENYFVSKAKGLSGMDIKERFRYEVLMLGKTLRECELENSYAYSDDYKELSQRRKEYITRKAEMPKFRNNFYVTGESGLGKSALSYELAQYFAKTYYPNLSEDEAIFMAGDAKFEGYDGQPIILWNDFRAGDLIASFSTRGNVFKAFNPNVTNERYNIKYGSVRLPNTINIVNSIQTFEDFVKNLTAVKKDRFTGEILENEEDRTQDFRRYGFWFKVTEEDIHFYVNKGYLREGTYSDYVGPIQIRGSLPEIYENTRGLEQRELVDKIIEIPANYYKKVKGITEAEVIDVVNPEWEEKKKYIGKTEDEILKEKRENGEKLKDFEVENVLFLIEKLTKEKEKLENDITSNYEKVMAFEGDLQDFYTGLENSKGKTRKKFYLSRIEQIKGFQKHLNLEREKMELRRTELRNEIAELNKNFWEAPKEDDTEDEDFLF